MVEEGVARQRAVTLGQRTGLAAQVLDGLSEGEVVILYPSELVDDGARVRAH